MNWQADFLCIFLFPWQPEETSGTIKEQLAAIAPILEQLWQQKDERIKEFSDVQSQIQKICGEIAGDFNPSDQTGPPEVDESDLSLKKLDEYQCQLQELQKEKVTLLYNPIMYKLVTYLKNSIYSLSYQQVESFVTLLCLAEWEVAQGSWICEYCTWSLFCPWYGLLQYCDWGSSKLKWFYWCSLQEHKQWHTS